MATQSNTQKTNQTAKRGADSGSSADSRGSAVSRSGGGAKRSSETGVRDETYGLVSVLYHSLQGAQTYAQYSADAERVGDEELVDFFQDCQSEEIERAARAKRLLASHLVDLEDEDEEDDDEDEDDEDDDDDET